MEEREGVEHLDSGSLRLPEGMRALAICPSYEIECTTSPQILLKFSCNLCRRRSEERIGFDKMEEQLGLCTKPDLSIRYAVSVSASSVDESKALLRMSSSLHWGFSLSMRRDLSEGDNLQLTPLYECCAWVFIHMRGRGCAKHRKTRDGPRVPYSILLL